MIILWTDSLSITSQNKNFRIYYLGVWFEWFFTFVEWFGCGVWGFFTIFFVSDCSLLSISVKLLLSTFALQTGLLYQSATNSTLPFLQIQDYSMKAREDLLQRHPHLEISKYWNYVIAFTLTNKTSIPPLLSVFYGLKKNASPGY